MLILVVGLALFLIVHLVPTSPGLRSGLIDRFGANAYKIGFSLVSAVGLALIVIGYGKVQVLAGKNPQLWIPPVWTRHVAFLLMLPAAILLFAAYVPSRIRAAVGHPMLAGIKLWALAHLLANGDLASILLFGSFLAYAVYDRISVKARGAGVAAAGRPAPLWGDLVAVALGLAFYAWMMLGGHAKLIGVALILIGTGNVR